MSESELYACKRCGKLRTKEEGGAIFSICEGCWDKIDRLKEEIKKLNEYNSVCTVHGNPSCLDCSAECSNAIAENKKLKEQIRRKDEALQKIKDFKLPSFNGERVWIISRGTYCHDIAEEALGEGK